MPNSTIITAGIDTSKAKLDIAVHDQKETIIVTNDAEGWNTLETWLRSAGVKRIGIEATGGYERGVTRYLQAADFTVVVFQPAQVKAFAKMNLRRAKSDQLDARLIAACTHLLDATNKMPPDPRFDDLAEGLTLIEQIEEDKARWKTRLEHTTDPRRRQIIRDKIKQLNQLRADELKLLTAALREYEDLAKRFNLVLSIPGIGKRTALSLIIRLPEIGEVTREQAAALAGLAPFVHKSGKFEGQTHIGGGRARLRRSLYAATLPSVFRWNEDLKNTYERLIKAGKCHKSAMVACARKMLIFAVAVVQRGTPWSATKAATA
jgi:transposase